VKGSLANTHLSGRDGSGSQGLSIELPPNTLRFLTGSLKQEWKRYRKGLKRCQLKFSEKAVHGFRVEARRLSSILELLAPFLTPGRFQKAQALLKEHLNTFDDLRDTQVQLTAVGKLLRAFPMAESFQEYLEKREARFSRQTRKKIDRVKTRRLGKLLLDCRQDVKSWCAKARHPQANVLLLRSISRAFTRVLSLKRRIRPKDTDTIHCTRVAFKRLRYMVETLADFLPGANPQLFEAMRRYQTMMGDVQDAEVLRRSFDRFLEKKKPEPPTARPLRQELLARRQFLIQVFLDASDQLLDFWPPRASPAAQFLAFPPALRSGRCASRAGSKALPRKSRSPSK